MEDTITVLERVWFDKEGKPYLWDRSYDDGEIWEVVTSPFAEIPFVLLKPESDDLQWIQMARREIPRAVSRPKP